MMTMNKPVILKDVVFDGNHAPSGSFGVHSLYSGKMAPMLTLSNITFVNHDFSDPSLAVMSSIGDITYSCPAGKWMKPSGMIRKDFVGCAFDCMPGTYGVMLAGIEHISLALTL
jgi:hypothetical protein